MLGPLITGTNRARIAAELCVTQATVSWQLSNMHAKAGVTDPLERADLVRRRPDLVEPARLVRAG